MGSLADLPVQILDKLGLGSILTSTLSDPPGTTQLMTRCAVITPLQSQELLGPRVFLGTEIKWRWGTSGVRGEADPSDAASSLWSFQPLPTPPTLWRSPVCCQTIWSPRGLRRSQDGSTWSLPAARRAGREGRGFLSSGKLGYGGGLPARGRWCQSELDRPPLQPFSPLILLLRGRFELWCYPDGRGWG